ncbi:sialate O-acetylesterase-like [Pomacea canaliculata]|nr:sialate O-acetylesterase-like [Pomacea canaliculata]
MKGLLLGLLFVVFADVQGALQLASVFGSHMVLQRAPKSAVIWGTATVEGDRVTAHVTGPGVNIAPVVTTVSHGAWKLKLHPVAEHGPFTISFTSGEGNVTLTDVLFGDVWLCSGQSNMGFRLNEIINSAAELQNAHNFPNIRIFKAALVESFTPQTSLRLNTPWTGPQNARALEDFSAVCWLFAEYLYPHLNYPIGLIESQYGGTPIEAWSPPEAIKDCASIAKRGPGNDSVLWNGMLNPILGTTFLGALWYQGESNANHASKYSCQIKALVTRWRSLFSQHSMGETEANFPFGYVQLAGYSPGDSVGQFPALRWAQTAGYGYSPNPVLPRTFMAVAMDLPDFSSPSGPIHPRFKQDVSQRLMLGALNVAYGHSDVVFQGPFPSKFQLDTVHHTLTIEYNGGRTPLEIRNNTGFEVCCSPAAATKCTEGHDTWHAAPITHHDTSHVTVSTSGCGANKATGLRYAWRTSPCLYKHCAVYGAGSGLPAPPYQTHTLPL